MTNSKRQAVCGLLAGSARCAGPAASQGAPRDETVPAYLVNERLIKREVPVFNLNLAGEAASFLERFRNRCLEHRADWGASAAQADAFVLPDAEGQHIGGQQ